MKELQRGILIAIEGIDGSGKSTLASNLTAALLRQKLPVLLTREPGDTPIGKHIRSMLHDATIPKNPKTEFLLFAADRSQHFDTVVIPALKRKQLVISDRMGDSSVVYQGYARGLDIDMIQTINTWAMDHHQPDIVLYVRVPAELAHERLIQRNLPLTSFEQELTSSNQKSKLFYQKLVDGFDRVMAQKNNSMTLDGSLPEQELTAEALHKVTQWLTNK